MRDSHIRKLAGRLILSVLLAGLIPLQAQKKTRYIPRPVEITPAENDKKTVSGKADYSAAFQKLIDLGLPDAAGAKYIKLEFAKDEKNDNPYSGGYQRYVVKREGNAWLLPNEDPKASAQTVIHGGFQFAKVAKKEKRSLIVRLVAGSDDKTRKGVRKAEWSEVDGTKEVAEIIEQFDTNETLGQLFDASNWSYDTSAMAVLGRLLMTACHLHRSGQIEAGNKLAHYILSKSPYPFKVIDHVVEELANAEYETLLDTLYADQKWQPFLKGLRDLSTKYPRGWTIQPGVKILIPKIVTHLRLGGSKITPYKNQPLNPEITTALDKLLTPTEPGRIINASAPNCWLINPKGNVRSEYFEGGPAPDWVLEIVAHGLETFPTLIAATTDETLIPAPVSAPSFRSSNDVYYGSRPNTDSDQETYNNMSRPGTRGEIARALLEQTLPGGTDWSSISSEEFQIMAYDWWRAHRQKSPAELAVLFLENGDDSQKSLAMQSLLKSGNEDAFPIVEEFILDRDSLMQNVDLAKQYLQQRKAKGKEFHDTFVARLREEMETNYPDEEMRKQIDEYLDQTLSGLSVLVNDIPPKKIMAQISSGEVTTEKGFPLLKVAIGEGKYLEHLGPLLTFISELKEPADRLNALEALQDWTYDDDFEPSEDGELTDYQKELRELATTHLETWKTFLTRKDTLAIDEKTLTTLGSPPTEAHYAAMIMDGIHHPETDSQLGTVNTISTSEEAWNLLLSRMEEFSKTGQVPVFPAAENVPEKRKEAILEKVKELPTKEIIPYRKSLELSERLAMSQMLDELEDVPENIAALSKICRSIDWRRAGDIPHSLRERIEAVIVGKELSVLTVEAIFEQLSKGKHGISFSFQGRANPIEGPFISASSVTKSGGSASYFVQEELKKLDGENVKRLEAIVAYGLSKENSEPRTAVRFVAPIDEAKEKAAFDQLLEEALAFFEPSKTKPERRSQGGFLLTTQTFENHTASSEEEDE